MASLDGNTDTAVDLAGGLRAQPCNTCCHYIHYVNCVSQAFFGHIHASAAHTVLMIMAFDRYVAICKPLSYSTIMINRMVVKLSVSAWMLPVVMVSILLGLSIRLSRCRKVIINPYCENASLFKLSCESVLINQIYGLGYTVVLLGSSMGSITLTYFKIAAVCLSRRNKVLNSRALQTCASHLTLYLVMLVTGIVNIALHRFPDLSDQQKLASIMYHVVPPALNPVIYGLQIQMVREILAKPNFHLKTKSSPELIKIKTLLSSL
ncbi:putative gustatory receptor clone PTE03 [Thalassophryne amazonica]|uniref:putative gustatory receptor clone PTE03 n=1 Tax=Thalassophryne amazonica TaxID=390379 RepID=UPI001471C6F0|nr:putative gustatory receptor clone PTE03 [Thalassophryne amazonica]